MAQDEPSSHPHNKPSDDVELAEVRLLSHPGESSSQANSWYSANGRGFSLNGVHAETAGGTSHVATVLGEAFYNRERRNQRIWRCITERPHRVYNMPAVALTLCSALLLLLLLRQGNPAASTTPVATIEASDADISPEGRVKMDFGANHDYRAQPRRLEASRAAVAADHGRCSDIGLAALEQGGNAVDAAVATALCQGIMNPMASGIGGGAFMLIRLPNGSATVIDARETAPAAANETMFQGNKTASLRGGLAVGVPLELKGLWLAHQRFGSAAWSSLVEPAANLARTGFPAHPYLVNAITGYVDSLEQYDGLRAVYLKPDGSNWRPPRVNESCCARPQLAALLDEVGQHGPDALYMSSKAQDLTSEIRDAGGILTVDDLRSAQPRAKEALHAQVYGLDIIGPPPPSSAAVVIAALHILEGYTVPFAFESGQSSHRFVEAMKTGFALRTHLGDPGQCTTAANCFLDLDSLLNSTLSTEFATQLRNNLTDATTQSTGVYGGVWHANSSAVEDHGTSHISIVDQGRMAVSMTTTVNTGFGSMVYSKSTGILLNNQMDDFSTPGQENVYGLAPSQANFIFPGKKPLSSMSPVMLSDPASGGLRIVVGASGGPRIISAVLSTIVRLVALGQDPLVAIAEPRLHHQLLPDVVAAERWNTSIASFSTPDSILEALRKRGHVVAASDWGAVAQLITVNPETSLLTAVSDPRKDGAPAGF